MNYDVGVVTQRLLISPGESYFAVPADAGVFSAAFLARTSGLDDAHRHAYTLLIDGLVADGVFSKLDVLYIYATQDSATALLNLVSASYPCTIVGAPAFVADRGFTGDDVSGTVSNYLDTGFNPAIAFSTKFTRNSSHLSVWSNTNVTPVNGGTAIGTSVTSPSYTSNVYCKFTDGNAYYRCNDSVSQGGIPNGDSRGFYLANRSGASAEQGYRNAIDQEMSSVAAGTIPSGNMYVLCRNLIGTGPTRGCPQQLAMASIGGGLTATDVSNFYARLGTYMAAIAGYVPITPPAAATYYVSTAGSDAADGLTTGTSWQTITKVNAGAYAPGSQILFNRGDTFTGNVRLSPTTVPDGGSQTTPIIVGAYGSGAKPIFNPNTAGEVGIVDIDRVNGITVQDLSLHATSVGTMPRGGVLIKNNSAARRKGIIIQRCDIGGIRYAQAVGDFGGNIFVEGFPGTGGFDTILAQNNDLHGLSGLTSRDDTGIAGFGNGKNILNFTQRGNLCYHIGGTGTGGFPPMGDGLDFNGVTGGLAEFNIVHDTAWNYTNPGGGPCGFLTASVSTIVWQFNESYNVMPGVETLMVDFDGFDFDNDSVNCTAQYNYAHDCYNAGMLLFGGGTWNNNTLRKNLCENNSRAGMTGFGGITIDAHSGNPTIHVDNNITYNDRTYSGAQFVTLGQGAVGMTVVGNFQGTVDSNILLVPRLTSTGPNIAYGLNNATNGYNPAATVTNNSFFPITGSLRFFWGNLEYSSVGAWETGSGKGPGNVLLGALPSPYPPTYSLSLSAGELTTAIDALDAAALITEIDQVGTRASALSTRLAGGDSPVSLAEFIALGFALVRAETAPATTLLDRIRTVMLAT